jgi:hypothetical protein
MLAFTVQFSRYGRNRSLLGTPSGMPFGRAVRVSALSEAAASSGPNSVLIQPGAPCARSADPPERESVLTAPSRASRMNSQCSTRKHGRPRRRSLRKDAGAP